MFCDSCWQEDALHVDCLLFYMGTADHPKRWRFMLNSTSCFAAETCLSAPLQRWMLHSDTCPLPSEARQASIAEAALKQ